MSHSQLTRLTNYQNKKKRSSPSSSPSLSSTESSFSSNSISYINQNFLFSNKTSTPTPTPTPTSSITSHSSCCSSCFYLNPSFNKPPLLSLLIHQNITTQCFFNVILSNLKHFLFSFMANHADMPATPGRKKQSGQQKREGLEREVSALRKMLEHEQKVNGILESFHHRQHGYVISIPKFLPPKKKELLAELAMVEGEISRLENQISQLQADLDREKKVNKQSKSVKWQTGTPNNNNFHRPSSIIPNDLNSTNKGISEKMGFDTKALHFISKAMKGDYNLNDYSVNEKLGFSDQKENQYLQEEAIKFQERVPRKSGMLIPSSPLRDPRSHTPKKERNLENPLDLPRKFPSTPIQSEEEMIQKLPPNKLSENIMKCLIFIFVRLLRTSRAMEIEKSGPLSRTPNFSLSFRAESSLNSKASLLLQKEKQQDPYGIFNMEGSIPRDIGPYKNLVRFTSSSMDPKCISGSSSIPLLLKLRILVNSLQRVDLRFLTYQQKLAFWINIYNACIMHGFLQYGVPSSRDKLLTLMNKATLNVGGNTINALAVEHFILRKSASSMMKEVYRKVEKDDKDANFCELYTLELSDPNVTFALCCGTYSSPAVKIYTAEGVVSELEKSKLEYLQASIVVTSAKRIGLPELLLRNMREFAPDPDSLIQWLCQQLPTSGSLRKSIVDCFRGLGNNAKVSSIIEKISYEFEFQYLLAI